MSCTVPGCTNRVGVCTENKMNISYHRFPYDIELRKAWVRNIRKNNGWSPSNHTRICSIHFEDSCFRVGYGRRQLHSYAVPTIFPNHPLSCQLKSTRKRKLVSKYDNADTSPISTSTAVNIDIEQPLPKKVNRTTQTKNVGAVSVDTELRKATKLVGLYKIMTKRRDTKMKHLQRKCSRLLKKNADLEAVIQKLVENLECGPVIILSNTYDLDNQLYI